MGTLGVVAFYSLKLNSKVPARMSENNEVGFAMHGACVYFHDTYYHSLGVSIVVIVA